MIFFLNAVHKKRFKVLENKISNDTLPHAEDSAYMFDAIWTAALALNACKSRLEETNKTFANFTYENGYEGPSSAELVNVIMIIKAVVLQTFLRCIQIWLPR